MQESKTVQFIAERVKVSSTLLTWGLDKALFTVVFLSFALTGPPTGARFWPNFTISAQEFMAEKRKEKNNSSTKIKQIKDCTVI